MSKRVIVTWALGLVVALAPAARTYANISEAAVLFLRIASGARPAGMGEAFVALADDATATHWNPAGLGRYPLSELWMDVPIPADRTVADFAVVENDVPERNYTRYDMWVLTEAESGFWESWRFKNPRIEPLEIPQGGYTFALVVDGAQSGPITLPGGVYQSVPDLASALQSAIDAVLLESGVSVRAMTDGDDAWARITSGSRGMTSSVTVVAASGELSPLFDRGRSVPGRGRDLIRATPPSNYTSTSAEATKLLGTGIWETGDEYEPDASEELVTLVKSRTGLPEGPELDLRVSQVAALNQRVPTDVLRQDWESIKTLGPDVVSDSLESQMATMFAANDVLNTDPDALADVQAEMADIAKRGKLTADDAFRMQVLSQRAIVPYLPEKLTFPFAMNLPGEVTVMVSRDRTLYLGTTRGVLMYVDGRSLALNDSAAGPAAAVVNDMDVTPTGALWVATDQGPSRYAASWTHYNSDRGWIDAPCKRVFVLGENEVFASTDNQLLRFDPEGDIWLPYFEYEAAIGDDLSRLPGKLLGIEDPVRGAAVADSLVRYSGLALGELEAGAQVRIAYHLTYRGEVLSMAKTADGTLWIGTDRGLVSISRDRRARRYGYASERIDAPTALTELATRYVGTDQPERAARLVARIRFDNGLEGDTVEAGRVVDVFNGVTGSAIHSLRADGKTLLAGTEFGMVEHDGKGKWYRYLHNNLEERRVHEMSERSGERWYAADDRVVVYGRPRREMTFMHVKWLPTLADDLYYEFLSGVFPIKGWGTIGANITFLSLGSQTRVDEFGNILGEFGTFELAATMSYGTRLSKSLAAGLSAKVIYSHLSDQGAGQEQGSGTATGVGVDMGLIWNTPLKRLDLGVALTNLGPDISYIDAAQADPLPRNLALGLAYRLVHTPYNKLTLVGEMNKDLVGSLKSINEQLDEAIFNGGVEYQYGSFIALRAGYIFDRQGDIKKPTLGAGLQYRNFLFDFAYIPSSASNKPLDNTTRLSLSVRW